MSRIRALLIILMTITIAMIYHLQKQLFKVHLEKILTYEVEDLGVRDPSVTCKFPILHPFHESILKYVFVSSPVSCTSRQELLTYIDNTGIIRYNTSALNEMGFKSSSDITCTYSEIMREDDFTVKFIPEKPLSGDDRPESDYVYVECRSKKGVKIYNNFHAYAQRNPSVREFLNNKELGVAVIGIDSLSRLNFMRQLPKAYKFITRTLDGIVFIGFNKVGENTIANTVPMLTGKHSPDAPYNNFKGWPFIWKEFEKEGVATMYSEDWTIMNMFDYTENGIYAQPTQHYMRTFWLAAENSFLYKMSSTYCLGSVPNHLIYLDYLKSFFRTYKDSPVFLFSLLNELSHNYLNTVGAIDDDLVSFLNSSFTEGLFNRTVVFVLGDHGNRIDSIRLTEVGKIEDRMPFVSIILPKWVHSSHPEWIASLRLNAKRLTSSFDLYKTFSEVLSNLRHSYKSSRDMENIFEVDSYPIPKHFRGKAQGMSLLKPIPTNRSCIDAGIPAWFCTCTAEKVLSPHDTRSREAALATISYFNNVLLKKYKDKCETYSLNEVLHSVEKQKNFVEVRFVVEPGYGLFESLIENTQGAYKVFGEVLRINWYGNQAKCLPREVLQRTPLLRSVCYCKH